MTVFPPDNRKVISPTTSSLFFPLPAVAALDIQTDFATRPGNGFGSAIVIAPNYALSAAHNLIRGRTEADRLRVTTSANQNGLNSRVIGTPGDPAKNVDNKFYLADYPNRRQKSNDIVLLKTSNSLLTSNDTIGLMAFVNPRDAVGRSIRTAGYPGDNVPGIPQANNLGIAGNTGTPGDSSREGRDLVLSPGFLNSGSIVRTKGKREFYYSQNVDTYDGQSGSGVWHTLEGDKPRVLGVHSGGVSRLGRQPIQGNRGVLLTTDLYDAIVEKITANSNSNNADLLPESAIIGSDSFLSFGGNDNIFGSFLRERILGNGGDDQLLGGGADDRLEGGDGVDQALFSDSFTDSNNEFNYDWSITNVGDTENPEFEFKHNLTGDQSDGKDTTKEIEFGVFEFFDADKDGEDDDGDLFYVPLQVDEGDNSKLKDGALIYPQEQVLDDEGEEIATMTVESPAWMFDGDVKYNLSIGIDTTELYNLAFIIDRSMSMGLTRLAQTKDAYSRLIDSLVESGIDSNTDYGVVDFNGTARLYTTSNPSQAKARIDGLVADGGTIFTNALSQAEIFFNSALRNNNAENIAYFISDGIPADATVFPIAASKLKLTADVRAFGIGRASLGTLNIIDSDGDAELLSSAGDLFEAFDTSIDINTVERIEVRLEGESDPIQTISPDELTENGFNFTYEGTIDGLEVSREAENNITFELIFKKEADLENVSLDYKITTGQ